MDNKQFPESEEQIPGEEITEQTPGEFQETSAPVEQELTQPTAEEVPEEPTAEEAEPQEPVAEEEAVAEEPIAEVTGEESGIQEQPLIFPVDNVLPTEHYVETEDPEAPECHEEDALAQELMEVEALLNDTPASETGLAKKEEQSEQIAEKVTAQPKKQPAAANERPVKKGRPKRKKGEGLFGIPNILATGVWLAMILVIGVTLGRMLWVCAADVLAFGRNDKPVTITIYESDSMDDIVDKLHRADLIRYPGLFKLYASFAVDEGEIRPGIWDLNTRYDYHALVRMMSPSSSRTVVKVMIPEGYSSAQIFDLLEENKVCTAKDLAAYAATGELDFYWFLDGIERGEENSLEGYLFPDTYQFYTNDSPRNVLQKMLDNFDYRFTEEMRNQLPTLNAHISEMMRADGRSQEYIDSHQLTLKDVVIVASLIEKETSSAQEGYTIASVIYNRLFSWGSTPAYLNIDAAMVYALGGKTDLTAEDLRIDHPYNTYLYTGLTPGPISNPGLASLKAALDPSDTPYYYYVLDPAAGAHKFSTTYEEHQAFINSMGG